MLLLSVLWLLWLPLLLAVLHVMLRQQRELLPVLL
jgi:hypothetical protein